MLLPVRGHRMLSFPPCRPDCDVRSPVARVSPRVDVAHVGRASRTVWTGKKPGSHAGTMARGEDDEELWTQRRVDTLAASVPAPDPHRHTLAQRVNWELRQTDDFAPAGEDDRSWQRTTMDISRGALREAYGSRGRRPAGNAAHTDAAGDAAQLPAFGECPQHLLGKLDHFGVAHEPVDHVMSPQQYVYVNGTLGNCPVCGGDPDSCGCKLPLRPMLLDVMAYGASANRNG